MSTGWLSRMSVILAVAATVGCKGKAPPTPASDVAGDSAVAEQALEDAHALEDAQAQADEPLAPATPDAAAAVADTVDATSTGREGVRAPKPRVARPTSNAEQARDLAAMAESMKLTPLAAMNSPPRDAGPPPIPPVVYVGGGAPQNGGSSTLKVGAGSTTRSTSNERKVEGPKGSVGIGHVKTSPPVAGADGAVAKLRSRLTRCYERGLASDPSMKGKMNATLKLAPSGEVTSATATSRTGVSATVTSCVERALRNAAFQAPGGSGATATVPITFARMK